MYFGKLNLRSWLWIGVFIFFASACSPAAVEAEPTSQPIETTQPAITILAFGDSLTEGFGVETAENYPTKLQAALQAAGYDVEVINGGISGETTTSAFSRVDWMLGTNPDIVIVETGANDALRGVDIAVTEANLDAIVQKFTDSGAVVVVAGLQIIQNLGDTYTSAFAAMYPTVAAKHDSILIPFVLEGVAADPDLNQPDFIHPTGEGYTVMVAHILPFVEQAIEMLGE